MHEIARPVFVNPVLGVVEPVWVRHGVQMVQVTEEFVEAVEGRQILVQVAQMVLTELLSCVSSPEVTHRKPVWDEPVSGGVPRRALGR
jgi:hypothetical protein